MSNQSVRALGFVAVVVLAAVGGTWLHGGPEAPPAATKPSFVLNITSGQEDLHAVTMALQLAGHALNDGRDVTLFLNVRAPVLARKDLPETVVFKDNPPVRKMLADLMQRGARVLACPACMKVMGVGDDDLAPGIQKATRELLFGQLGPDAAVFSY